MNFIGFHVGHDGSICRISGEDLLHVELERLTRKKHYFTDVKLFTLEK